MINLLGVDAHVEGNTLWDILAVLDDLRKYEPKANTIVLIQQRVDGFLKTLQLLLLFNETLGRQLKDLGNE